MGIDESLRALRRWATSGATQHPSGAMAGWRDTESGSLSAEYPEITGYLLTYAASTAAEEGVARRALRWLGDRVRAGNLAARDGDGPTIYNFDLAMMATGLITAGAALARQQDVAAGLELVEHLRRQVDRHGFLPTLDGSRRPSRRPPAWSTVGRAHLVKVVQAFLIADRDGMPGMVEAAVFGHRWGNDGDRPGIRRHVAPSPDVRRRGLLGLGYGAGRLASDGQSSRAGRAGVGGAASERRVPSGGRWWDTIV